MTFSLLLILASGTSTHAISRIAFESAITASYIEAGTAHVCTGHMAFKFGSARISAETCSPAIFRDGFEP